jgi:hypothetical protein
MRRSFMLLIAVSIALPAAAQDQSTSELKLTADAADRFKLDKNALPYRDIRDNAKLAWAYTSLADVTPQMIVEMKHEEQAYDFLLHQASKFSQAELEAYARRDVTWGDLRGNNRLSFKMDVIYMEGALRRLRKCDTTPYLKEQGIEAVYEAWIFPRREIDEPVCIFLTQLPPGIEPQKDLSKEMPSYWVAVAGYSFKLFQYEQQRLVGRNHKLGAAPALMAKSFTVLATPADQDGGAAWRTEFLPYVIAGFTGVGLSLAGLAWWYRRGDKAVLAAANGIRNQNPFENVQHSTTMDNS